MKKMTRVITTVFLLLCHAVPCPGQEALTNTTIAVMKPGKGIGDIALGEPVAGVIKKMDGRKPKDGKTVRVGAKTEYWLRYPDMGITLIFDKQKRLSRVAVTNPGIIVLQNGLRVHSHVSEVEKVYGESGNQNALDDEYEQRTYDDKGISFTVNRRTGKIEAITILPRTPGPIKKQPGQ